MWRPPCQMWGVRGLVAFPSCEFSGQTQKIVPGYGRREEGPGRMRLLPGYDGHVRFAGVAPGPYYLSVRAPSDCASVRQRWKISVQAAEIELRSFTVTCEQGKK